MTDTERKSSYAEEAPPEPMVLTVDDLRVAATQLAHQIGTILQLPDDRGGIRRTDRTSAWRGVRIDTVAVTGFGPYQDRVTTYEIAFEGGTPSASPGWELAHATFPPLRPLPEGTISSPPFAERQAAHQEKVKNKVQALLEWEADGTDGRPRGMGQTYLRSWAFVPDRSDRWKSVYEAVVVKPNMS